MGRTTQRRDAKATSRGDSNNFGDGSIHDLLPEVTGQEQSLQLLQPGRQGGGVRHDVHQT